MKELKELKEEYYPALVKWAERKGFENIKLNSTGEDFETPIAYERQDDNDVFTPDATAYLTFKKSYFEIILKTEDTERLAAKLKLMSALALKNTGRLLLMTPRGNHAFAKRLKEEYTIFGEIIKIEKD